MKQRKGIRFFLQLVVFLSLFAVIGSAGAWETGDIGFLQFLLQLVLFTGIGAIGAFANKKRAALARCVRRRSAGARHTPSTQRGGSPIPQRHASCAYTA